MSDFDRNRVSCPEPFYDGLTKPQTSDPTLVYRELASSLDVPILGEDWQSLHTTWGRISVALTMHESAIMQEEPRSQIEIGNRVLDLMVKYPWLAWARSRGPRNQDSIDAGEFCEWSSNHVFDDYPGLFGISCQEGWTLRGRAQMVFYDREKPDMELVDALDLPRKLELL